MVVERVVGGGIGHPDICVQVRDGGTLYTIRDGKCDCAGSQPCAHMLYYEDPALAAEAEAIVAKVDPPQDRRWRHSYYVGVAVRAFRARRAGENRYDALEAEDPPTSWAGRVWDAAWESETP